MRERPRGYDPDEKFTLPEDTDPDDVLRGLLGVENVGADEVEPEAEDTE